MCSIHTCRTILPVTALTNPVQPKSFHTSLEQVQICSLPLFTVRPCCAAAYCYYRAIIMWSLPVQAMKLMYKTVSAAILHAWTPSACSSAYCVMFLSIFGRFQVKQVVWAHQCLLTTPSATDKHVEPWVKLLMIARLQILSRLRRWSSSSSLSMSPMLPVQVLFLSC